jgi:hypothetical protein
MCHISTMELYLAIKKNGLVQSVVAQINLEDTVLS